MSIREYELGQNIAQGSLTNSKHPDRFVKGVYPQVISHGRSCYLYDLEGRKYVDFVCGLGANLFGYGNERIERELDKVSKHGQCHSLPTMYEIIAAKRVKEVFPWVDKVKFLNDGSSACTAALRIARAYQDNHNKDVVYSEGYHGWHDEFTSLTPPANGIGGNFDRCIHDSRYEEYHPEEIAAIIVEPVIIDDSRERIEELKILRYYCTKHDICLIFDETITALRYPKLSVSNCFNIEPDLIIFGKALGNGEKISCLAGKSKYMDCDYFVSGTFHGHVRSLVAAKTCLDLVKGNPHYDIEKLKDEGEFFMEEFNEACRDIIQLHGYGTRGVFQGENYKKALFFQEMCKARFLLGPSFFLNWDLLPHLENVIYTAKIICGQIRKGEVVLEGSLPTSPFSSKARE